MTADVIDLERYRWTLAVRGYRRTIRIRNKLARESGERAGRSGQPYTECPYPLASIEGCAWIEGWRFCFGSAFK